MILQSTFRQKPKNQEKVGLCGRIGDLVFLYQHLLKSIITKIILGSHGDPLERLKKR